MRRRQMVASATGLVLSAILFWVVSCALNPVTGERELMLLSEPDEIRLGQKTDGQIVKSYGMYDDAALSAYMEDLGQRLAKVSHRSHLPFQFKVLDSAVVNAFAVPGGYVYLTRGILSYLNNEAELAGVIGHEIGHVAARHSAEQYSRAQLAQVGLAVGMILAEDFREYSGLAQLGVGMLFMKFSRDNERQADDLGVEYATKAGYDASRMADFFSSLERLHPSSDRSGLPGWFSTHPNPPDRIRAAQQMAREWAQQLPARELEVNQEAYLRQIDGLIFGEDPREGYVGDGVFYHPGLTFQFPVPSDWKLNNTPAQVQIVSKEKNAVILFSMAPGSSPKEVARKFVSETKAQVMRSDTVKVNGFPTQRIISDVGTQRGPIRIMSYFIEKDERIYVFHGFTPQPLFQEYAALFQKTMDGFKTLTDLQRIGVQPDRLALQVTARDGALEDILRSLGVPDDKFEELALLNGKGLQDRIPANTLIKVVKRGR